MHRSTPHFSTNVVVFATTSVVAFATLGPFSATAFGQGDNGFLRGEGHTDVAFSISQEKFGSFWVGDHKMKDPAVGDVRRESYNFWGAYGLTNDIDLVGSFSFVAAESSGSGDFKKNKTIQDGAFGAKWRVFEQRLGPGAFSALGAPAIKIPLSHYEDDDVTALGDGQIDLRLRAIVQYQLDCGAYVAIESGYDVRFEGTPNEIPLNISVGATIFDRLTLTPFISWVDSLGNDDIGQVPFPEVAESYTRGGVAGYLKVNERLGLTGGYKTTFQGQNTGDSWSAWLGAVLRF